MLVYCKEILYLKQLHKALIAKEKVTQSWESTRNNRIEILLVSLFRLNFFDKSMIISWWLKSKAIFSILLTVSGTKFVIGFDDTVCFLHTLLTSGDNNKDQNLGILRV